MPPLSQLLLFSSQPVLNQGSMTGSRMFQMASEDRGTGLGAEKELRSAELGAIKTGQDRVIIQVTGWWKRELALLGEETS